MPKFVWLGDEDPSQQVITHLGYTFVKGEPSEYISDKYVVAALKGNPLFSDDEKAEPVAAVEPEPVDPDEGTVKGYLRRELATRGVRVQGNASVETLRNKLAEAAE